MMLTIGVSPKEDICSGNCSLISHENILLVKSDDLGMFGIGALSIID